MNVIQNIVYVYCIDELFVIFTKKFSFYPQKFFISDVIIF